MTRQTMSAFGLASTALVLTAVWSVTAASAAQPAPPTGRVTYSRNPDNTWTYQITNAATADGRDTALAFPLCYQEIQLGDTVTWVNQDTTQSYTVTFPDASGAYPDPNSPGGLASAGGPVYDGSAPASSGVLVPAGQPGAHSFTLTFTAQAVFQFRNLLDTDPHHVGVISILAMYWAGAPVPSVPVNNSV